MSFRLTYGAESLAHALLPGLVAAAALGLPLLGGALAAAVVVAALIALAGRDERVGPEAATAVTVTGAVGAGALLALAPATPQRLGELLFGDPLAASASELAVAAGLSAAGGLALLALQRPLAALALEPAGAGGGPSPLGVRLALAALVGLTVCIAAQGVGTLLALAAFVGPAVAVRGHVRSVATAMTAAAVVAVAAAVAGLYASFHLETAAGASIGLALCGAAAAGRLAARLRRRPRAA